MKKEQLVSIILTILSLGATFAAGYFTNQMLNPPELEFPILSQAREIMENHAWYEAPSLQAQEYGMIRGLVEAYDDPYASFVEPAQHELYSNTFEGSFGGIGSQITINENGDTVLYPYPDSPAKEAGIRDHDIVIDVDGTPITKDTPLDTTVSLLRGPVGHKVSVTVYRETEDQSYTFSIRREEFAIPSVSYRLLDQDNTVGLIQVNLIAASTPDEILEAAGALSSDGAQYFILDLRDNYGGLLESGVEIARLFLADGDIITHQLVGSDPVTYQVEGEGDLAEIPLAVLINHNTASAAEIIAGALQSHGRVELIGTPSYGKNTIQLVFKLADDSSIHITAGKWWLPGQAEVEDFFLAPDLPVSPENYSDAEYFRLAMEALLQP